LGLEGPPVRPPCRPVSVARQRRIHQRDAGLSGIALPRLLEHAAMRDLGPAEITPPGPWLDPKRVVYDMQHVADRPGSEPKLAADLSVAQAG
jgi:hypothetical protein